MESVNVMHEMWQQIKHLEGESAKPPNYFVHTAGTGEIYLQILDLLFKQTYFLYNVSSKKSRSNQRM